MTRGGRDRKREGPERRCIATGESGGTAGLIRFVRGPDDSVVPDVAGKLPGRGVWLTADRALVEKAVAKRLFARAFRAAVTVAPDLADRLEALLVDRLVASIALARKAGQAVTGFERTREMLRSGRAGVLLEASDGAADGRTKLRRTAQGLPVVGCLDARELGLAFGRDFAIHGALAAGGVADRVLQEANRLSGLRLRSEAAVGGWQGCGSTGAASDDNTGIEPATGSGQDCG